MVKTGLSMVTVTDKTLRDRFSLKLADTIPYIL